MTRQSLDMYGDKSSVASNTTGESSAVIVGTNYDPYGEPVLLSAQVFRDRVEHVYRRECMVTSWERNPPQIYKIITTWINGETFQTKVMGTYEPPTEEYYHFD